MRRPSPFLNHHQQSERRQNHNFPCKHGYLLHQDQVCLYQCKQITAASPSQCLIISMKNASTRLRLEFIRYNPNHILSLSQEWSQFPVSLANPATLLVTPYQVCLYQCKQFTAASPFHRLIISMRSGWTRLRLEFIRYNPPITVRSQFPLQTLLLSTSRSSVFV